MKWDRYFKWQLANRHAELRMLLASIDEFESLKDLVRREFPKEAPRNVMDLACGMGRSTVFLARMLDWNESFFYLVDGEKRVHGPKTSMLETQLNFHKHVTEIFDRGATFYTDFDLLDKFLVSNGVANYNIIAANEEKDRLAELRNVDFLFSFHAVGYHRDIGATLDYYKLHDVVRPGALLVFGIRWEGDPHCHLDRAALAVRGYEEVGIIEKGILQRFLVLRRNLP